MAFPSIFEQQTVDTLIARIDRLAPDTQPQWGKMNAAQMMAHTCVAYDMALTDKYPKSGFLKRILVTFFAKSQVVSEKPYPRNGRTAPEFVISDQRDFAVEKSRLIDNIMKTFKLGTTHFDGKESLSFGALTVTEWNNLFYKHLDHHLTQFGV
jgi:hypothetical protein